MRTGERGSFISKTRKVRANSTFAAVLLVVPVVFDGATARAQDIATPQPANQAAVLAINVALGALTAGIGRVISHKPVKKAAVYGGLGGAASYVGKRVIARSDPVTNLLGREFSAAGASVVANAGSGVGPLDRFVFPYGPLRVHWDRLAPRHFSAKLDVATTLETAWTVRKGGVRLDVERTLSSGAPTFSVDSGRAGNVQLPDVGGSQIAGVILHRDQTRFIGEATSTIDRTLGHELVHLAQYDFSFITVAAPAERSVLQRTKGTAWINKYMDLGLNVPTWSGLNRLIPYHHRPWEIEASTFSHLREVKP